jgi:hypothetical protein
MAKHAYLIVAIPLYCLYVLAMAVVTAPLWLPLVIGILTLCCK